MRSGCLAPQGTKRNHPVTCFRTPPQNIRSEGWFNIEWQHRKKWTIDHTKVSGSGNLSGFPVLINVTDADFQAALTNGDDFVLTRANGKTKIPHEIEKWDDATGELILWFKSDVFATQDTEGFIYYNNSSAANQQDPTNVWNSNYKVVCHMNQIPPASILDSTSNAVNGTTTGLTRVEEDLNFVLNGDGVDDRLNFSSSVAAVGNTGTWSFRVKVFNDDEFDRLFGMSGFDFEIALGDTPPTLQLYNGAWWKSSLQLTAGVYFDVDVVRHSASSWEIFLGGSSQDTATTEPGTGGISNSGFALFNKTSGANESLNCSIGEFRLSDIARSADYLKTLADNRSFSATFITFGSEEDAP